MGGALGMAAATLYGGGACPPAAGCCWYCCCGGGPCWYPPCCGGYPGCGPAAYGAPWTGGCPYGPWGALPIRGAFSSLMPAGGGLVCGCSGGYTPSLIGNCETMWAATGQEARVRVWAGRHHAVYRLGCKHRLADHRSCAAMERDNAKRGECTRVGRGWSW